MSDFTTTFENESFINSEIRSSENIGSNLNNEEVMNSSLGVVEETTSELNSDSEVKSLLDEPLVHRYNEKDSDNIEVSVDNEKYEISATIKQIRFRSFENFPEIGSEKLIYIANDTKEIFGWDSSSGYFKIKVGETYDDTEIREEIDLLKENKANVTELDKYYTKKQVDDILASGSVDIDLSDYYKKTETYSKTETNNLLNNKVDKSVVNTIQDDIGTLKIDNASNKANISNLENLKANKDEVTLALQNKANKDEIPYVGNFITRAVDDLVNYYTKEDTYSQAEVRQLISEIPKFNIEVITGFPTNPSETTIYLLRATTGESGNLYSEYIYVNGIWEKLGEQKLDLSGYATTESLNEAINNFKEEISTGNFITSGMVYDFNETKKFVTEEEKTYWNGKVNVDVSNLTNYYKKAETYTKTETQSLLDAGLSTKANKSELESYVTKTGLESTLVSKGYLTQDALNGYATESYVSTSVAGLDSQLRTLINKKADVSALNLLEEEVGNVAYNLSTVRKKYLTSAFVTNDGKTLQIYDQDNKATLFEGGGGTEYTAGNGINIENGVISSEHPIGSYYICKTGSSDPSSLFGGSWKQIRTNVALPLGGTAKVITSSSDNLIKSTNALHFRKSDGSDTHASPSGGSFLGLNYDNMYVQQANSGNNKGSVYPVNLIADFTTASSVLYVDIWEREA